MKKISLLITIIALSCATISTHINADQTIYIRNNYGATIAAQVVWPNPQDNRPEIRIENGKTVKIDKSSMFKKWGLDLLIRTTGTGSGLGLSPYTSIRSYIDQIIQDNSNYRNAIITINEGNYMNPWWSINVSYSND